MVQKWFQRQEFDKIIFNHLAKVGALRNHEDMLVKEQLWIQLLNPRINEDFTEDNIHDQHNLEIS